jgi:hypothetical protein
VTRQKRMRKAVRSIRRRKQKEMALALDEGLVEEARLLGLHRTREEALGAALEEYIRLRRQKQILVVYGPTGGEDDEE